jgi:hypothetical protein
MRTPALALASLLAASAARAQELPPHVREGGDPIGRAHVSLRAEFVGGMFAPAVGGSLRATVGWSVWNTASATGALDVGVRLGMLYGDQHLYPWVNAQELQGTDVQLTAAVVLGHTFHLGRARRFSLGVHGFFGGSHYLQAWTVDFSREGHRASSSESRGWWIYGPEISLGWRVAARVSVGASVSGAWPWDRGGSVLHAGLGVTVHLR